MNTSFTREGLRKSGRIIGVTNRYFEVANVGVSEGKLFSNHQLQHADPVCIIGRQIKARFFAKVNPIGQSIKCGNVWLTVVGVLESGTISDKTVEKLSIRDYNSDIYLPIRTVLLRYKNRGAISPVAMKRNMWDDDDNNNKKKTPENYHQIDRLVVNISESKHIESSVALLDKILKRRHNEVLDYAIVLP